MDRLIFEKLIVVQDKLAPSNLSIYRLKHANQLIAYLQYIDDNLSGYGNVNYDIKAVHTDTTHLRALTTIDIQVSKPSSAYTPQDKLLKFIKHRDKAVKHAIKAINDYIREDR